jgi:hypothetical protein
LTGRESLEAAKMHACFVTNAAGNQRRYVLSRRVQPDDGFAPAAALARIAFVCSVGRENRAICRS